jgi:hypothetical protein
LCAEQIGIAKQILSGMVYLGRRHVEKPGIFFPHLWYPPLFRKKYNPAIGKKETQKNVVKFERIAACPKFHRVIWKYKKSCSFSSKQNHIASF